MYCTSCGVDSELCCDEESHKDLWEDACYCDNCGTICSEGDLNREDLCEECEEE